MIIFLYGDDTYRLRQHLRKLIERFKKERDPQGYNVAFLDCAKSEPNDILYQIHTAPLFSDKRLVVLERLLSAGSEELKTEIQKRIENNSLPASAILVIVETQKIGKNSFFEILKKQEFVQEFVPLVGNKLVKWIVNEAKLQELEIESDAAEYIAENVNDSWTVNSIMNQLVGYTGGRRAVTLEDVNVFLSEKFDNNIFSLIDAVSSRNQKQAFRLLEEQFNAATNENYIFSMLAWQFRSLLGVFCAKQDNIEGGSAGIAKNLGISPFVVKKCFALLPRYTKEDFSFIYNGLFNIDKSVKTGQVDLRTLLMVFIGKVTSLSNSQTI
jgi:DNA polymerase-3 subunit delta